MSAAEDYKKYGDILLKNPNDAFALVNMAATVSNRELIKTQLALMKRAAAIDPNEFNVQFNLGCCLMRSGQYDDSQAALIKALQLSDKNQDKAQQRIARQYLAMVYHDLGKFDLAEANYDWAIASGNIDPDIKRDRALSIIAHGQLLRGFEALEDRWLVIPKNKIWEANIPLWDGTRLDGKTIIVSHEQGFGDTLQVCRFLPRLKELGAARVIFSGPVNLMDLIASNFDVEVISDEGQFEADLHCPMMSLPYRLKIDWPDIKGEPYLKREPRKLPPRAKLNIGLCWAGSAKYVADSARSMQLSDLTDLFTLPTVAIYSLQKGAARSEIGMNGIGGLIADLDPMLTDWRATARIVAGLDAVVTVDTAIAHLAGALGVPCFVMIPNSHCWRWIRGRQDTPWYSSMKLFRQSKPFDWTDVVLAVKNELISRDK